MTAFGGAAGVGASRAQFLQRYVAHSPRAAALRAGSRPDVRGGIQQLYTMYLYDLYGLNANLSIR